MRRILVDRARKRNAQKRGGNAKHLKLDEGMVATDERPDQVIALDDAIKRLSTHHEQAATLVKLRFFGGMQHQEAAEVMGISRPRGRSFVTVARAWLYRQLKNE